MLMLGFFTASVAEKGENKSFLEACIDFVKKDPAFAAVCVVGVPLGYAATSKLYTRFIADKQNPQKTLRKPSCRTPGPNSLSNEETNLKKVLSTKPVKEKEPEQKKIVLSEPDKPTGLKKLLKKNKPIKPTVPKVIQTISPARHKTKQIKNSEPKKKIIPYKPSQKTDVCQKRYLQKPLVFTFASIVLIAAGIVWSLWKKKPIKDSVTPAVALLRSAGHSPSINSRHRRNGEKKIKKTTHAP